MSEKCMLPDWLESLLTPCPRPLRAMGYVRELFKIRKAHRSWGAAWEDHFRRTKDILCRAVALCPRRRQAVVLGSGWLHDVPLADLAAAFGEVILVDAVHPFHARRRARRFRNVRLLTADVTGVAEAVHRIARTPGAALPRVRPTLFCGDSEVDLVASVNVLSQLPYLPEQYLALAGVHPADEILSFARDVVLAHLDYLRRLPGVVALVADVEGLTVSRVGRVVRRSSTVYGVELPWAGESWLWPLLPEAAAFPHHGKHRRVVGIPDVNRAALQ